MSPLLKLFVGAGIIAAATVYLAWLGASTGWQYYVLVDECTQSPKTFADQRLRVSGRIAPASLHIGADRASATFVLRGHSSELEVACRGLLPDNLVEDMEVVVEGKLNEAGSLVGERIITRCASKYETDDPPAQATASMVSGTAPR